MPAEPDPPVAASAAKSAPTELVRDAHPPTAANDNHQTLALLTIIPEATAAVRRRFGLRTPDTSHNGRIYYYGGLQIPDWGTLTVVNLEAPERSNIPAAIATYDFIADWEPDYFLLVDIGASFAPTSQALQRERVLLGDVVVAKGEIHYFEFVKQQERGPDLLRRITRATPDINLAQTAEDISDQEIRWWQDLAGRPATPPQDRAEPQVHTGELVAGEKLLANPSSAILKSIRRSYNPVAVDMESAGAAHAVHRAAARYSNPVQFQVIRGISDYCDLPATQNQETRDLWKDYAARSAAAFAYRLIIHSTETGQPQTVLEKYLQREESALQRQPTIHPFATTFHEKESPDNSQPTTELYEFLQHRSRVLLQGEAGIGKTALLRRLAREVLDDGAAPVLMVLKEFDRDGWDDLIDSPPGTPARLNVLLACSEASANNVTLFKLPVGVRQVLLLDGLNEIAGETYVSGCISTVNAYVNGTPNALVLITDRLAQRGLPPDWTVCEADPLTEEVVVRETSEMQRGALSTEEMLLLRKPFFLNEALRRGTPHLGTATEALEAFFREQFHLDDNDLSALAAAAFDAYAQSQSRIFSLDRFQGILARRANLTEVLQGAGVVNATGLGRAEFAHQIQHDYLAARYLARQPALWRHESFDAITFRANSPQALDMVLRQLTNMEVGDELIRTVYNWSWRIAVNLAAIASALPRPLCSSDMQVTLAAMHAEKRLDRMPHTRRAAESIPRFSDATAASIQQSPTAARSLVQAHGGTTPWFSLWRELFVSGRGPEEVREALVGNDGLMGWTAVSVLRRRPIAAEGVETLRALFGEHRGIDPRPAVVRWRIVHALGAATAADAVEVLLEALQDSYVWVAYGAARSLVEMAAKEVDQRGRIVETLRNALPGLDALVLEEVAKATLYDGPAEGWAQPASLLVTAVQELAAKRELPLAVRARDIMQTLAERRAE